MSSLAGLVNYSDQDSSEDEQVQPSVQPPVKTVKTPIVHERPPIDPQLHHVLAKKTRLMSALAPKPIDGVDNWGIPNEPTQPCDVERAQRIAHFLSLRASGNRLNQHLAHNKAFRNPRIYTKLVEFTDVDEIGSNMDINEFDPHGFHPSLYIDGILETQRELAEAKAKKGSVQFVKSELTEEQSQVMAKAMANAAKIASRITENTQK